MELRKVNLIKLLALAHLLTVVNGIHQPSAFVSNPSAELSVVKKNVQLFQLRGGDDGLESSSSDAIGVDDVQGETIMEDASTTTTTTDETSELIQENAPPTELTNNNLLVTLLSPIINVKNFYMNSLSSYPVPTIVITVALISLIIWNILSSNHAVEEEKSITTKSEVVKAMDTATHLQDRVTKAKIMSGRNLLTGVGTAAATTFAIYQVVTRPPSSSQNDDNNDGGDIALCNTMDTIEITEDNDNGSESGTTVFKGV